MSELKATTIRRKFKTFCDFFERTIREKDLVYDEGYNRDQALEEIEKIKTSANAARSFTIAFVGEYSSGKTTLINLLTGHDYKTGADVSTEAPQEVSWNGITLIDTPGLGSGRPEHDTATEEWLARADLLVYILTPDLLTSQAGERFLTMLDRYKREGELMLVMNQIDKEENSLDVYRSELQKALDPRPLADYFPTFVSAEYKRKSLLDKYSKDEQEEFMRDSRFETFLENLNHFVLDRRERAALTTPLTWLEVLLRKIRFRNQYDKEDCLIDKKLSVVEEAQRDTRNAFRDYSEKLQDYAKETRGHLFRHLEEGAHDVKEHLEKDLREFEERLAKAIQDQETLDEIAQIWDELLRQNTTLDQSPLAKTVFSRIEHMATLKEILGKIALESFDSEIRSPFEKIKENFHEFEQRFESNLPEGMERMEDVMHSTNILSASGKLLGKIDKNTVLKVGHAFGMKFKPFGAIKIANKFSKAVPVLTVAAALWEGYAHIKEKQKQKEADQQKREWKESVKGVLDEAVKYTCEETHKVLFQPLEELLDITRRILLQKKSDLAKYSTDMASVRKEFEETRDQCRLLYDEIYGTETDEEP